MALLACAQRMCPCTALSPTLSMLLGVGDQHSQTTARGHSDDVKGDLVEQWLRERAEDQRHRLVIGVVHDRGLLGKLDPVALLQIADAVG